jgi:hypothetical protein
VDRPRIGIVAAEFSLAAVPFEWLRHVNRLKRTAKIAEHRLWHACDLESHRQMPTIDPDLDADAGAVAAVPFSLTPTANDGNDAEQIDLFGGTA